MIEINKFSRLIEIGKALKPQFQTGKSFHCSFAIKKGKIQVIGTNTYAKSNPICQTYKRTKYHGDSEFYNAGIHSEQYVLGRLKHRDRLDDLTLVNIRINNNNQLDYSCPCVNCIEHLFKNPHRRFKKVIFSTINGFLEFPDN